MKDFIIGGLLACAVVLSTIRAVLTKVFLEVQAAGLLEILILSTLFGIILLCWAVVRLRRQSLRDDEEQLGFGRERWRGTHVLVPLLLHGSQGMEGCSECENSEDAWDAVLPELLVSREAHPDHPRKLKPYSFPTMPV